MRLWRLAGRILFWLTWPALYFALQDTKRTRVLVVCSNRILVLQGWLSTDDWGLPGGGLHKNEPVIAGAQREVLEEVGIRLQADNFIDLGEFAYRFHGIPIQSHLLAVRLATEPQLAMQKLEVVATAWLEPTQLTAKNSSSEVLEAYRRLVAIA